MREENLVNFAWNGEESDTRNYASISSYQILFITHCPTKIKIKSSVIREILTDWDFFGYMKEHIAWLNRFRSLQTFINDSHYVQVMIFCSMCFAASWQEKVMVISQRKWPLGEQKWEPLIHGNFCNWKEKTPMGWGMIIWGWILLNFQVNRFIEEWIESMKPSKKWWYTTH